MVCSESTLELLEYPELRRQLAGQTVSMPGRRLAEALTPLDGLEQIEAALTEVDEAVRVLDSAGAPPLGDSRDLLPLLERVQAEGSFLGGEQLLDIAASIAVAGNCRDWFGQCPAAERLSARALRLEKLPELGRRLRDSIGRLGELLDTASPELADLRRDLRQTRNRVKQRLEQLLNSDLLSACFQERLVTVRNGRYVVPLKADHRGQVKGFVQDESSSGQTLYLEPETILEGNNRIQQLLREEQREERRVLLRLADLVRCCTSALSSNQDILACLDLRFAAGRLSRRCRGSRPQLVSRPLVELKQARHPLLMSAADGSFDCERAVPIDLRLGEDCHALVISGPNTGGKSVALKTLGLLLLMVRSGLHIPCQPDSRLYLFQRLFADIGDEQSIAESLSTFSGHLVRVRDILQQADAGSLVLLDEAGTGTDPAEGAALALAVLDRLREQGAKVLLTTHLGQIKAYAQSQEGVESAAVDFDPQTLAPRYHLHYGIPGASSAISTARRLGLPGDVVRRAEDYLGERALDSAELIYQLNCQRQQLNEELTALSAEKEAAVRHQQRRLDQLLQLKARKKEILARAVRQGEQLVAATEQRLRRLSRKGANPQENVELSGELRQVREELQLFKPRRRRQGPVPQQLVCGELVRVTSLGVEARVEQVFDGSVELTVGGKRLRQPLSALEQFEPRRFSEPGRKGMGHRRPRCESADRPLRTRLLLVGKRVEDALPELERFLDDALLGNLNQVEIVHGSGEGILRRAVRDFLAGQKPVTAFYAATAEQGGENVTIAELGER
ncbi:MAG: endonuclease MutS2 [Desulfuromonadales bacterium]|nr:endonuclease MutS2 [Desulfuromonadales bacterium]